MTEEKKEKYKAYNYFIQADKVPDIMQKLFNKLPFDTETVGNDIVVITTLETQEKL